MAALTTMLCFFALFCLVPHIVTSRTYELTILHTNDFHSRFEEIDVNGGICSQVDKQDGKCFGGAARIKALIQYQRNVHDNVLVLDAGNQATGTPWFYFYGQNVIAKFMNFLGYDAMALGEHEFDEGVDGLVTLVTNATFPIISANLDTTKEPRLHGKIISSKTFLVGAHLIGIVGYTSPSADPGHFLSISDEITAIQREVDQLIFTGVNKIIALGHSGFETDVKIAKNVKGVDVVVGGKDNTFLYNGTAPSTETPKGVYPHVVTQNDGTKVLVVQTYGNGKYMGALQVSFDENGKLESWNGNPILLDNSIPQAADILSKMQPFIESIFNKTSKAIGITFVPLAYERCTIGECNIGNLIADAMLWETAVRSTSQWNTISVAMMNSGGIRARLSPGAVTFGKIIQSLPSVKNFVMVELKGKHIVDMFEFIADEYVKGIDTSKPYSGFPQVSGIKIKFALHRPVGKRVDTLLVRCHSCAIPEFFPIDLNAVYPIAMSKYTARGGDGLQIIRDKAISVIDVEARLSKALEDYLTDRAPIITGLENRIVFLPEDTPCKSWCTPCLSTSNQSPAINPLGVLITVILLCVSGELVRLVM